MYKLYLKDIKKFIEYLYGERQVISISNILGSFPVEKAIFFHDAHCKHSCISLTIDGEYSVSTTSKLSDSTRCIVLGSDTHGGLIEEWNLNNIYIELDDNDSLYICSTAFSLGTILKVINNEVCV